MKTRLIEFPNSLDQKLRWVMTLPGSKPDKGVICLHGFERCATTEKKFKIIADRLAGRLIATLRFDFSWCGLSDGDFRFTTIEKQGEDFINAVKAFNEEAGLLQVNIIAHSLWACILATQIHRIREQTSKIVLIAPSLNQRELLRYWFVTSQMKKNNPNIEITWRNYKEYLNERDFLRDCEINDRMTRVNYLNPEYFRSSKDLDYSACFAWDNSNVLHIHWNNDIVVPLESLRVNFENRIIVENWDHDMERPNQIEQWIDKCVDFL